MSKAKSSAIPHYELLYLVANKFSEDELKPIMEKVNKSITDNEGKITFSQEWGKKRLSYPIKNYRHGYYNLVEFDILGEQLIKIDRALRMMGEILRHQIVLKKIKSAEEIQRDKKIAEKIAAKNVEEERMEKEKVEPKEKVDLKELDEKLERILESDDLL